MGVSSLGRGAEERAARFLESAGFHILARNFRTRLGEIDLVADDGDTVVLVEVKYRSDENFAPVEEALTASKRKKLWKAGRVAAMRFGENKKIRFDFIAMIGPAENPQVRHYQNVLDGDDL